MPDASLSHRLNRLTLRFDETIQEQAFRDRAPPWLRAQFRPALAIGIPLDMLVGVPDPWVIPDDRRLFVRGVRFAAMAFPVAVFAFSFQPLFGKYHNGLSALTGLAAELGLVPVMWTMSRHSGTSRCMCARSSGNPIRSPASAATSFSCSRATSNRLKRPLSSHGG
jgi:hypothetical protein